MSPAEDDVFQDNAPPIVDIEVLEASKENVQPLASGRRVTALAAVLATPHAQRDSQLKSVRKRLRINVQTSLEDEFGDPLEEYCRFIYWTVENYPQGHSAESGLLELLEEATRVLKDDRDGIWRGELKYLKLWVLYASYVEKPVIVFKFLLANDIGSDHAMLYEEYADALEREGRRTAADDVYILGIARQAFPLERLQSRHREFQKRMMSSAPAPTPPSATSSQSTKRTVLGATSASSSSIASSSSTTRSPHSSTDVFTASPSTQPPVPNARLQIFVDPSGSEPQDASQPPTNSWSELGTRKTRIKENVPEVKKLGGSTLKQPGRSRRVVSGPSTSSSSSKMAVFRDPGPDESASMPPPPIPATKKESVTKTPAKSAFVLVRDSDADESSGSVPATPKFTPFRDDTAIATPSSGASTSESIMKTKNPGLSVSTEAEALRKDPFKNYDARERPVGED